MKLLQQFFYRGWVINIYDNEEEHLFRYEYTVKKGRRKYWDPTSNMHVEAAIAYAKEEVDDRSCRKKKARWKGRKRSRK
jgi:hypothetical protein